MSADVHALTGAYVLNSVSDDERAEFERHLRECETCTQEVREFRATTTRLGRAAAATPPAHLKAAVMAQIRQVRQDPPQASVTPLRRRRGSMGQRLTSVAAAVFLVVSGVLGVLLVQERSADQPTAAEVAALAILRSGDAKIVTEGEQDSGRMTVLSSRSADRALLFAQNLPAPGPDQDYQAWTITGDEATPAGLLPDGGDATLEVGGIDAAEVVGITVEPAGGSDRPSGEPIMVFDVS